MLLLCLTNLFCAPGGIPAFNRLLVRAAAEYAFERSEGLRVVVLNDDVGVKSEGTLQDLYPAAYLPCGGDRRRLLREVLRELPRRPSVLLGHVNLAPVGLPFLAARGFGVVAHGTDVWTLLPFLRRQALLQARAVACVSDHTARCVELLQGVRASRCVRVINALQEARFEAILSQKAALPTPPEGVPQGMIARRAGHGATEKTRLLSVTRLHPAEPKGIDLVLRALPCLPGVRYTVAGEGGALPALKALAEDLGVADRVTFAGRVSDEERERLLVDCDVFVLPSSGEGFGIVYLEAMAHGKPCVAAQVGGAPEVVLHGITGLVVPPVVGPLRDALQALIAGPDLRKCLGEAGRARVRDHFRYPHFRQRAFSLLDRLA